MADLDLRSTIEAAAAAVEKETPAPVIDVEAKVVPETPEKVEKVEEPTPSDTKIEEPEGSTPAPDQKKTVEEPKPEVKGVDKAPQSWKPAEKAKWQTLDPDIRAEITRREKETTRVMNEAAPARKFVEGFQRVVTPHMERFQRQGLTATQGVEALLAADRILSTAQPAEKAQRFAQMIKDYGVDIGMLDQAISGLDVSKTDPLAQVDARIQSAIAPLLQTVQQTQAQQQAAIQADFERQQAAVEAMAEDPKFPLFDMVREDMADIIEINLRRGVTLPLPDVYNRAVQVNPEASAEAAKLTKQAQAQKANGAAQRSLAASLSVSGNPGALKTTPEATDLRGTLESAFLQHTGRTQ